VRSLTANSDPFVRGHAGWALWLLGGVDALRGLFQRESDDGVLAELGTLVG
jgi:hypothetical protein